MATINPPAVTLNDEAVAAIQGWMANQVTGFPTSLDAAANNVTTTLTVVDGAGLGNKALLIGAEVVVVTNRSGKTLTVTRGALGTVAAAHSKGDAVGVLSYADIKYLARAFVISGLKSIAKDINPMATVATKSATRATLAAEIQAAIDAAIQ